MKYKHFREEADDSRRLLNDGHHHLKDKHDTLVKKAEEHGRWVRTIRRQSDITFKTMLKPSNFFYGP